MRDDVFPEEIVCSRCGRRFTREHPAKAWHWSYRPYWPVHRECPPPSATLGPEDDQEGVPD
jgi:hypothetical protein